MPTVPVPDTAQVEIRATLAGVAIENVLTFLYDGTLDAGLLLDLATEISTWWVANVMPELAAQYVLKEVYARDLTSGSPYTATYTGDMGETGSFATGEAVPNNVAWVVKFLTALSGRSYRGRNYIAGLSEAIISGNAVGSGDAAAIVGAYQMLLGGGGILPTDFLWVIVSRFLAGAPRVTGICTPVAAVTYTDLYVDTQRKRLS